MLLKFVYKAFLLYSFRQYELKYIFINKNPTLIF